MVMATSTAPVAATDVTYSYLCDAHKSITTTLHLPADDFANVNLSDGRHLILAHTVSADGARYASANEGVVFWTRGTRHSSPRTARRRIRAA